MAILKHLLVTIDVDGQSLEEYDDDEASATSPNVISTYVEATTEKSFVVRMQVTRNFMFVVDALTFVIFIDGQKLDNLMFWRKDQDKQKVMQASLSGVSEERGGIWRERPFIFSEMHIGTTTTHGLDTSSFGSIEVHVHRKSLCIPQDVASGVRLPSYSDSSRRAGFAESSMLKSVIQSGQSLRDQTINAPIHMLEAETKGKCVSHSIRLGAQYPIENIESYRTQPIDDPKRPYATFKFKYRSRKVLQNMLLIPQTPPPLPMEEKPFEQLTREERDEMARRFQLQFRLRQQHRLDAENSIIKREVVNGADLSESNAERDSGSKRRLHEEYARSLMSATPRKKARLRSSFNR